MRRIVKNVANKALAGIGLHITTRQLERSPEDQLTLALKHFQIDTVLDVGANIGQFAASLYETGYRGSVFSVEPLPDAHAALCRRASGHTGWKVVDQLALGSYDGSIEIIVAGNSYSSSVLTMLERHIAAAPKSAPVDKITVRMTTIDHLFEQIARPPAKTLLKIDTQGYEYSILQGASEVLKNAHLVLLELSLQPLYQDQVLWLDLVEYMQRVGFSIWSIQPEFCDPTTGQLLQINGLFYRIPGPVDIMESLF